METAKNDVVVFVANNNAHALEVEKVRLEFMFRLEEMRHRHAMEIVTLLAPAMQATFSLFERQVASQEARNRHSMELETVREEQRQTERLREIEKEEEREAQREAREAAEEARRNERHQLEMERFKR